MRKNVTIAVLAIVAVVLLLAHMTQPAKAQNTLTTPEWVVKDSNGTLVGGLSILAFHGQNWVSFHNDTDDENFYLTVRRDRLSGEFPNVYYTNADCTGTPYIESPSDSNGISALRGSSYGIARKVGATDEDSYVVRGTGAGSDNSGILQSRFRAIDTPQCTMTSTSNNTVVATVVMDLSHFVRPFVAD